MRKKIICILSVILLLCFAGCGTPEPVPMKEAAITFDQKTEVDAAGIEKGLLVEEKKYDYKSGNVVIMQITNQTGAALDLSLHMEYQNEEGRTTFAENREFSGFGGGYRDYFVFYPNMPFADYTYTLTAEPHEGESYTQYIVGSPTDVALISSPSIDPSMAVVTVHGCYALSNSYSAQLYVETDLVLFDNTGKIHLIMNHSDAVRPQEGEPETVHMHIIDDTGVLWKNRSDYQLPEELQGEVTGLIAVKRVEVEDWLDIPSGGF